MTALVTLAAVAGWTRWAAVKAPSFDRVTRIVATSAHESSPAISPDGKWIAYLSNARGPTDLWVKFIDGGEPANLTAGLTVNLQTQDYVSGIQISPDGAQITFVAAAPGTSGRDYASWVIPAPLGGTPRRVLEAAKQGLTWSPDGARIAYLGIGGSSGDTVWVADADGQHPREIVAAKGGRHTHWLRWSRDGRFVYFNYGPQSFNTEPTEIFRVPADGGPVEPVLRTTRRALFAFPDFDGRGLFYAANPDTVDLGLWWRDLARGRDYRLINGIGEYGVPSVSADGSRLVAPVSIAEQHIARIDLGGAAPPALTPVTDALSGDVNPSWSRDGSRVVFSSLRGGNRNIWMARADFTGPVPLTLGSTMDERPSFAPDGREIAFVSDRGGRRGVWLVNTEGQAPRLLVAADVLGSLSWSHDGRLLVCSVATGGRLNLALISRETGQIRSLTVPGTATSPVWSPREDVIAYLETEPGGLAALRAVHPDGTPAPLPPASQPYQFTGNSSIAWSPDGRRLAGAGTPGTTRGSVWIVDLDGGAATRQLLSLPPATVVHGLSWTHDGSALTVGLVTRSGDIILAERQRAVK